MGIGLKSTQIHVWNNHILRNKTAGNVLVILTAGENTCLKSSAKRIDFVVLGQQFCDWLKMKSRFSSSPQGEGKNKELRTPRSEIKEFKHHNLEKEDKGYGNLDLEEYDKLFKRQYNIGYYYDQKREEESVSREKLDYFSEKIKENYGINNTKKETYSQFTENQSNKDKEATESYQAFNLAL
ncbi:hypothetical protein O181_129388 [Austropuccinia psidii MF-1]|uniref:Uncharacterized protein n=1 Tax=Austropuccinia psidii MF-1 TaxID=1389203 RepID=A0A9Q3KY25_9BASI|nr:hypothetical protein [Austropuccinia psidii MF-1]